MLAAVDGFISSAYSWSLDAEVRQINEATGQLQSVIPITGATGTGAAAGPRLDLLQGLVTWQTPDVADGRNVKGRFFVPGPTEDHNNTQGRPEVSGYVGGIQP
ncbi:hypothetical protein, partial [Clostridium diolis]|uniref:hypothetical protein n=1 Tax=Clostridium diolis TaxID=223919 RepID=UPI0011B22EEC